MCLQKLQWPLRTSQLLCTSVWSQGRILTNRHSPSEIIQVYLTSVCMLQLSILVEKCGQILNALFLQDLCEIIRGL